MRVARCMRSPTALCCNGALLFRIHGCEPAIAGIALAARLTIATLVAAFAVLIIVISAAAALIAALISTLIRACHVVLL